MQSHSHTFGSKALPMMFYTAINLRQYLPELKPPASFLSLAVAYFNIVLPSFLPSSASPESVFWSRCRTVKTQCRRYLMSPMLISRTQQMSKERGKRAKAFARKDTLLATTSHVRAAPRSVLQTTAPFSLPSKPQQTTSGAPPSIVLLGLSQLNNIDAIYNEKLYPSIEIMHMAGGTRKGNGGILMFSRTFRGCLHLSLGWDSHGFQEGIVEDFWGQVLGCVDEFLVQNTSGGLHRL